MHHNSSLLSIACSFDYNKYSVNFCKVGNEILYNSTFDALCDYCAVIVLLNSNICLICKSLEIEHAISYCINRNIFPSARIEREWYSNSDA